MFSAAKLSYLGITPRKVRLVSDIIRGENVEKAQTILNFTRKEASLPILKLLKQAVANAKVKDSQIDEKNLYISKILVNEGPRLKRSFPRARGSADVILKRTSHITIVLDRIKGKAARKRKAKIKDTKVKSEKDLDEKKHFKAQEKEGKEDIKEEKHKSIKDRKGTLDFKAAKPRSQRGIRRFFRRKAM